MGDLPAPKPKKLPVGCRLCWAERVIWARQSTIENKPTDFVAQLLVVKHEIPDFVWKLCTLPFALKATSFFSPTVKRRRTHGLDRVGRSTELVCGDMRHHCRLASSICSVPSGSAQLSSRSHGMATRGAGLRHRDLASRPSTSQFDGSTRPIINRLHFLEKVQHMLCAIGCQYRKQVMIGVLEGTAATYGDEPGVALLW
jgi:hypothetical protein